MRRSFKPYNKRKIFKKKSGGPRFLLGSSPTKFEFPSSQMPQNSSKGLMNLLQLILGQKRPSYVKISNK